MVIKGIGIDIADISRFRNTSFETNRQFYQKIFNEDEIKYCLGKADPYQHFAVRFCAKEAFVKAKSNAVNQKIDYKSISVVLKHSKPFIIYNRKEYLLSLSHDQDKAIAVVVIE